MGALRRRGRRWRRNGMAWFAGIRSVSRLAATSSNVPQNVHCWICFPMCLRTCASKNNVPWFFGIRSVLRLAQTVLFLYVFCIFWGWKFLCAMFAGMCVWRNSTAFFLAIRSVSRLAQTLTHVAQKVHCWICFPCVYRDVRRPSLVCLREDLVELGSSLTEAGGRKLIGTSARGS